MKNLLLASTSTLHGSDYLEYLLPELKQHFTNCKTILFIPYARPNGISHEEYTEKTALAFAKIKLTIRGIHEYENPVEAIQNAEGIFTGGGNTFLLVNELYRNKIMIPLKETLEKGIPYLGTSAGSNISGLSMQTTNDMPIVYPPSFQTLGLIPFNLNVHFQDADTQSKHMGESRETRINEFHQFNNFPVLGLKEGSWLEIKANKIVLKGNLSAKLFRKNATPIDIAAESELSFIQ
ncbi:dipeptidase E [Flavobacterium flevense]|uniref:Dipeptidase E n=1 Tax=Flavobacterium flevense TaxID=983 RepID=A0A4Y4ASC2_9FLAO|nr:dipeptidase PepE [Flavobacterium flevense]GEC71095.1 dipeptidase E [Flavobacterium flevense]SHL33586.1 dipeptidase E [Flavobacterium flevense]